MFPFDPTDFIPFFVLSIPMIAIVGGISAGLVRLMHRQRAWELLQRERIAAIERGIDPEKIAQHQPHLLDALGSFGDPREVERQRVHRLRQGLMIAGVLSLSLGAGLAIMIPAVSDEQRLWIIGVIPMIMGVGLLVCAALMRPLATPPAPLSRPQ